jgi:DNA-binding response OmpR family regulator
VQVHSELDWTCAAICAPKPHSALPIFWYGQLRSESDTVAGFKAGADDYVMKPFRPAEVVARIEGLLERARRQYDLSPLTGLPVTRAVQSS